MNGIPTPRPAGDDQPENPVVPIVPDAVQLDLDALYAGAELAGKNAGTWWASCAKQVMTELRMRGTDFTSDDFYALVPEVDQPNRIGAMFVAAAKSGLIVAVGARKSTRPERHGGLVRVWRGVANSGSEVTAA